MCRGDPSEFCDLCALFAALIGLDAVGSPYTARPGRPDPPDRPACSGAMKLFDSQGEPRDMACGDPLCKDCDIPQILTMSKTVRDRFLTLSV